MSERIEQLKDLLDRRIAVLDGSWGVLIQREVKGEEAYRGERFRDHPRDVAGDPDLLNITRPEVVLGIHRDYFAAGADIATTNTFTATSIGQADYALEDAAYEMNVQGARLARQAADELDRPAWVAGSIGPLNVSLSVSPRVDDPMYRSHTFDQVVETYAEQIRALVEGGVDLLLIETIFDTLNAKAAVAAALDVAPDVPRWISFTAIDKSGRNLSGQTVEAFWASIEHAEPLIVGVNCSLGATEMRPFVEGLARVAPTYVSCHPNAGLPNEMGLHDEQPGDTSRFLHDFAAEGLLNVVGGCCGTTPEHVKAIVAATEGLAAREVPPRRDASVVQRHGAVRDRPRHRLRPDRGADERHRQRALPPHGRGGRLAGRARGRARAGARRREPPRREHGRRPARRRSGDDHVPQPDRHRARGRAHPDHGRQLALGGPRGRHEVHPGQGRRQLDLAQGRRGGVPRAGRAGSAATARR